MTDPQKKSEARPKIRKQPQNQSVTEDDFARLEFYRHGLALFPDPGDKRPGVAIIVDDPSAQLRQRFCSCTVSNKRTCRHLKKLSQLQKALFKRLKGQTLEADFRSSIWHALAEAMWEENRNPLHSVKMKSLAFNGRRIVKVYDASGQEMLQYHGEDPSEARFLARCRKRPKENSVPSRGKILDQLALMTRTPNERMMQEQGFKTRRQDREESFWFRLAYHAYREFGPDGCTFHPAIEETTGAFTVAVKDRGANLQFRLIIPRSRVKQVLTTFDTLLPNGHGLAVHPIPLKSIFKVSSQTQLDLEVRPLIQLIQEDGESRFFEREDLETFRYGNLIYIKEMGILAELEPEGKPMRKFTTPKRMHLKKSQIPSFFEAFSEENADTSSLVDQELKPLKIIRTFDRIEITPAYLDRDWCWLSVSYGYGNVSVSLRDILSAKNEGRRYIGTNRGWIDCNAPALKGLDPVLKRYKEDPSHDSETGPIALTRMDLFRLNAATSVPMAVSGQNSTADGFKKLLDFKPARSLPPLKGMTSTLRTYQKRGVEWIHFLFENGLGGLLCDDMGLGKTHEVMAFLLSLYEGAGIKGPYLVVCPTTVLSHWEDKVKTHVPVLKPILYHGVTRDLATAGGQNTLLITSYGILVRDIQNLKDMSYPIVIFDEIQNIKNPQTKAYKAAAALEAGMKLGLTGTPVENRLTELKALLDLTAPGYLGADHDFETRFVHPIEADPESPKAHTLSRLISPFTLRRRKETVLDDLPEKFEDIRTCRLSEDQVKLYQDALAKRGKGLLRELKNEEKAVPYIHIFTLLSLLKQICNHPALLHDGDGDYDAYASGKWDLFKELLGESLDSGQKVVVYSQFVKMIDIMASHLKQADVGFVSLTGKSRNRGDLITRFNTDPDCRVYLGSLRAGGVGIDLVAASIVIHYDMWWNAAREDQATDRVHRIGQRRGVQVFKLITQGTLEEKIAAIIQKKRNLMDQVVKETDPAVLKQFSRKELMDLLIFPS